MVLKPLTRWFTKFSRRNNFIYDFGGLARESAVTATLCDGQWVGMIYLDIVEFVLTEQVAGPSNSLRLLQSLESLARKEASQYLKPYRLLEIRRWGDDLLIYFYSTAGAPPESPNLSSLAFSLKEKLSSDLNSKYSHLIPMTINFHVGYTIIKPDNNVEKSLYTALKEAMMIAKDRLDAKELERWHQFKDILSQKNIKIVYQPVVDLTTGEILGYESLSRGPEGTFFASPLNLFGYAMKTNHLYGLEKIAREKAFAKLGKTIREKKLFININPQVVNDPSFRPDEISDFLAELGAGPSQVVFEITERTSIDDFASFRKSLEQYRQHGFLIAIDDAGAGYSSLQAIAEIQPDFIKIDYSLIQDIDKIATKKKLLETFQTFAQKTNSLLIAEGIENEDELVTLKKLEIPYGQGFFLARPNFPPPDVDQSVLSCLNEVMKVSAKVTAGRMIPVRSIAQNVPTLSVKALTREALDFFTANPKIEGMAVTEEDEFPVGLVMRDKLFNQLGTQYGFAIYTERPISLVMDTQPLMAEDDSPVEVVSQAAMGRLDHKVYDSIILTRNRRYHRLVSVRALLDVLTTMQMEVARFANPLTGLPGNLKIEEEILNRLSADRPFSIIYADLDYFKGFNDRYGFDKGDDAIRLTADVINGMVRECGCEDDLVGHIGGDDFVVITVPEAVDNVSQSICSKFDLLIPELYDPEDRLRGKIFTVDRQEREVEIPIMTISLAIINCLPGRFTNPEELARAAAELKKYAKAKPGSVYVKERRKSRTT